MNSKPERCRIISPDIRGYFEDCELSRHIKNQAKILAFARGYDLMAMAAAKRKRERRFVTVPPAIRKEKINGEA
jgi:hypothetical protein